MKTQDVRVSVIATVRQNYGGRWYQRGDEMHVTEKDARDMFAMQLAVMGQPSPKKNAYKRRDLRAE